MAMSASTFYASTDNLPEDGMSEHRPVHMSEGAFNAVAQFIAERGGDLAQLIDDGHIVRVPALQDVSVLRTFNAQLGKAVRDLFWTKGDLNSAEYMTLIGGYIMSKTIPGSNAPPDAVNLTVLGSRIGASRETVSKATEHLESLGLLNRGEDRDAKTGHRIVKLSAGRRLEFDEALPEAPHREGARQRARQRRCHDCGGTRFDPVYRCRNCGHVQADEPAPAAGTTAHNSADAAESEPIASSAGDHLENIDITYKANKEVGAEGFDVVTPPRNYRGGLPNDLAPGRYVIDGHVTYVIGPAELEAHEEDVPAMDLPARADPETPSLFEGRREQRERPMQQAPRPPHRGEMDHPGEHQWVGMIAQPGMWCRLCGEELERKEA